MIKAAFLTLALLVGFAPATAVHATQKTQDICEVLVKRASRKGKILRRGAVLLLGGLGGASYVARKKPAEMVLASGYMAKNLCTCLNVMEQSEVFCREYVKQMPDMLLNLTISPDHKTVETNAKTSSVRYRAVFDQDSGGCILF